jgi:hypothetical protein
LLPASRCTLKREFSLREDPGNSYVVWRKLLQDYLNAALSDAMISFVIDGIDEAEPEEQEILFSLLEKNVRSRGGQYPNAIAAGYTSQ